MKRFRHSARIVERKVRIATAVCTCAAVLAVVQASATTPASAKSVPYFARDAAQEAVLSEMALGPAAIEAEGVTYLAYQGPGFDPYIASYEASSQSWTAPIRIGRNPLRLDAHGAPALYRDSAGRVHAFYGAHGGSILHARQSSPDRSSAWSTQPALWGGTYPQAVSLADTDLMLFYRTSDGHWSYRVSTDGAVTFGGEQRVLAADYRAYWYANYHAAPDGTVHTVFTWLDRDLMRDGRLFVRRNLYYAVRDPGGSWRGVDGTRLALPLTLTEADAHCRLVDSGDRFVNEVSVRTDDEGVPCVLYLIGNGSGPGAYEWRFARRDAGGWRGTRIVTTDHYFDAAALDPRADGSLEAFVVTGDSDARGSLDWDYRGRGGRIERWVSDDRGLTWEFAERVSPGEPRIIYSDPVIVHGGADPARVLFTDWTDDESDFFHRMFLWGESGLIPRDTALSTARIAGRNRSSTAIQVSRSSFPEGSRSVVIATEGDFPDALAGAPLASSVNGPILLTPARYLPDEVAAEIGRLGAKNAIVLGGTAAVSDTVVSQLRSKAGVTSIERVGGHDRYETSLLISRRMRDRTRTIATAVVVSGRNWPDAVAAAPLASANDWPIVLADGNWLPDDSRRILSEYGITSTVIVGQRDVVGGVVEARLPSPVRVGGNDRFETAAMMAEYSLRHGLLPGRVILATGFDFPDALAAGPLGGRARAPVLLVRPTGTTPPAEAYASAHRETLVDIWAIGETDVVSDSVLGSIGRIAGSP
ncbi:MAG TPA: hypothetical protein DCP20_09680 [Coriobacteriia bacterium]|nr:MAG: N-acetylmuramoyl-L-alanine amidase [Actinobacteria bacterium 66_15]HAL30965.1 hypothetical protein [Coriobacteriia bacterium]